MELILRIADTNGTSARDELLDLNTWLLNEDGFRGRTRLVEIPPSPGTMGAVLDAVAVAVPSGIAISEVARVVIAWLQARRVKVSVEARGGKVIVDGLGGLNAGEAQRLIEQVVRTLGTGADESS